MVFSVRQADEISALLLKLDHPRRVIGLLRSNQMANTPAVERRQLHERIKEIRDLTCRHELIVVCGCGSW